MENLIKMDDLGGKTPILGNIHISFNFPSTSELLTRPLKVLHGDFAKPWPVARFAFAQSTWARVIDWQAQVDDFPRERWRNS